MNASSVVGFRKKVEQNFPLYYIMKKLPICSNGWKINKYINMENVHCRLAYF